MRGPTSQPPLSSLSPVPASGKYGLYSKYLLCVTIKDNYLLTYQFHIKPKTTNILKCCANHYYVYYATRLRLKKEKKRSDKLQ